MRTCPKGSKLKGGRGKEGRELEEKEKKKREKIVDVCFVPFSFLYKTKLVFKNETRGEGGCVKRWRGEDIRIGLHGRKREVNDLSEDRLPEGEGRWVRVGKDWETPCVDRGGTRIGVERRGTKEQALGKPEKNNAGAKCLVYDCLHSLGSWLLAGVTPSGGWACARLGLISSSSSSSSSSSLRKSY
jgi:hypothetical protein